MIRTFVLSLAMAALVAGAGPAVAQQRAGANTVTVNVGGRPIVLVIAPGQCELVRSQPVDRNVLDLAQRAIQGQNELLLHTAECGNLDAARQGHAKFLNDFGQAQVSIQFKNQELRGQEAAAAKEICGALRTQAAQIQKQVDGEIKERVKGLQVGIAVNETRPLGVLGEDATACYSGLLLNLKTNTGETRLIIGVYAITVLNGRLVYLYRFLAEPPEGAVETMLENVKASVADHVALNNRPVNRRQ